MKMDLDQNQITDHISRQLMTMFGPCDDIENFIQEALFRTEKCFLPNRNKYYSNDENDVMFSLFHSGQYSIFLFYLANTIHRTRTNPGLANRVYYLNKIMHSVDWYYEIDLPEYWGVEHPLASVLGRAQYNNGLFIYQGCTVGGNNGKYPVLGRNVILFSNVTVLGDTHIGDNVIISTGSTLVDTIIPDNCLVFGRSPNLVIKPRTPEDMAQRIAKFWK